MKKMDLASIADKFVMGSGGNNPGVTNLCPQTLVQKAVLKTAPTHSIYSITIEPETGKIAAGSRKGIVYILTPNDEQQRKNSATNLIPALYNEAPILSLVWLNENYLAVTDTLGNCKIWSCAETTDLSKLPTDGKPICSLQKVDTKQVVGLDVTGNLLIWNYKNGSLLETIPLLKPPKKYSLVNMVYMPSQFTLAYPGINGELVFFNLYTKEQVHFPAHEGNFYAIFTDDEQLFSIGQHDCLLKTWNSENTKPLNSYSIAQNIIAAAGIGNPTHQIITVNSFGNGNIYALSQAEPKLIGTVLKKNLRTIIGTTHPGTPTNLDSTKNELKILTAHIMKCYEQGRIDDTKQCHDRLTKLGYEHVSLWLKAEHKLSAGNFIDGLKHYYNIFELISSDTPDCYRLLHNYAHLLEKAWLLDQADTIYTLLQDLNNKSAQSLSIDSIELSKKSSGSKNKIIIPDFSVTEILQAAIAINTPLTGRFLLKQFQEISFMKLRCYADEFAEKYRSLSVKLQKEKSFIVNIESVSFKGKDIDQECEIVNITIIPKEQSPHFSLAVKLSSTEHGSIFCPMLLFDSRNPDNKLNPQKYNSVISQLLSSNNIRIQEINLASAYVLLKQTVSQLFNEKMSNIRAPECI